MRVIPARIETLLKMDIAGKKIFEPSGYPLFEGTLILSDIDHAKGLLSLDHPIKNVNKLGEKIYTDSNCTKLYWEKLIHDLCDQFLIIGWPQATLINDQNLEHVLNTHKLDDLMSAADSLSYKLFNNIPKKYDLSEIRNKLRGYFPYLICYLCVESEKNHLAESILSCFYAGGLPCGWKGDYPDGNVVCYWPHDEEPTFADNPVYPWHAMTKKT